MQTVHPHTIKKISVEKRHLPEIRRSPLVFPGKKRIKRKRFRRLSPFLLLSYLLPLLFTYSFLTGKVNGGNFWSQLSILVFAEINVLFVDFAIWNYYRYKKVFGIWLIESLIAGVLAYLII
jgi:hypothetical protein